MGTGVRGGVRETREMQTPDDIRKGFSRSNWAGASYARYRQRKQ